MGCDVGVSTPEGSQPVLGQLSPDTSECEMVLEVANLPDGRQVRVRQYVWSDMHRTDEPYGEIGPMHIGPLRIAKRYYPFTRSPLYPCMKPKV